MSSQSRYTTTANGKLPPMALDITTTSGMMPACSKANILPVRPKTALDFVDNQRHTRLLGDAAQAAQPVEVGRDYAAFTLHHFNNHRRRQQHASFRVVKQVFQVVQVDPHTLRTAQTKRAAVIVGIRQELHAIAKQRPQGFFGPRLPIRLKAPWLMP